MRWDIWIVGFLFVHFLMMNSSVDIEVCKTECRLRRGINMIALTKAFKFEPQTVEVFFLLNLKQLFVRILS